MGGYRCHSEKNGKSSQNSPTLVIFRCSIPYYFVCISKVVSHHGSSVLSMSVMGFKKSLDGGGVSTIHFLGNIFTLQSPLQGWATITQAWGNCTDVLLAKRRTERPFQQC